MKYDKIILDTDICIKIGNYEKEYMIGTKEEGKNWGEVVSLSMAKTLSIPYFVSDEGKLQPIVNKYLNTGNEYDISVVRVEHIVVWIKENRDCDIGRKTAKALWRSCGKNISEFDEVIWKV